MVHTQNGSKLKSESRQGTNRKLEYREACNTIQRLTSPSRKPTTPQSKSMSGREFADCPICAGSGRGQGSKRYNILSSIICKEIPLTQNRGEQCAGCGPKGFLVFSQTEGHSNAAVAKASVRDNSAPKPGQGGSRTAQGRTAPRR